MILIVGLGNPGRKYQKTRHNIGFQTIDEFFKENKDTSNFSDFKLIKKLQSEISKGRFNNQKIILARPQTFINLSGKGAKLLLNFYKTPLSGLVVVHDDIDLPLGKIRIVKNRGAAGHKGVESIIKELRTKNFVRFRIGIRPRQKPAAKSEKQLEKFVLQKFNKDEEKVVKEVIKKTVEAIEFAIKEGIEKAMSKYNV